MRLNALVGLASLLILPTTVSLETAFALPVPPRAWSGVASDGQTVYIAGGGTCDFESCGNFGQDPVKAFEAINLPNLTSTPLPALSRARHSLGAAEVNGKVYLIGGDEGAGPVATVQAFNIATGAWDQVQPLQAPRSKAAIGAIGQHIYAAGGLNTGNSCQPVSSVEEFDVDQGQWTSIASLPTSRWGAGAATIDGKLYVVGGSHKCPHIIIDPVSVNESYDPTTQSWSSHAPMPTARWGHVVAALGGKLYAIGGWDPVSESILPTVEAYDPATDSWSKLADLRTARVGAAAVVVNNTLYVIGGLSPNGQTPDVEVYDTGRNEWQFLSGSRPQADFDFSPASPSPRASVQFRDTSTGSVLAWTWDFDGDGAADSLAEDPTWSFPHTGTYPVTLRVSNPYGFDSVTKQLVVAGDGTAPVITSVSREWPGVFLEGVSLDDQFDLGVDWTGTPGSIAVAVDGSAPSTVPGTSSGGSFTLDLGSITPRWTPTAIEITPTNGEGVAGATQTEYLHLFPYPAWLEQSLSLGGSLTFTTGAGQVFGNVRWEFPHPRLSGVISIPSYVPYLGGDLGIEDSFAAVTGQFSSDGTGSLGLEGQTGFRALGGSIAGRVGGSGDFRLFAPEGLVLTGASFSLGISGTIRREMGVIDAIPQLASVATIGPIRWFNERAKLIGAITPSLDMSASFGADDGGYLVFRGGTGRLGIDLKATLEADVIPEHLTASGWVAGGGSMTLGVPAPLLRELEAHVEAGVDYEFDALFLAYEGQFRCRAWCNWSPGTTVTCETDSCDSSTSSAGLVPRSHEGNVATIRRSYGKFGRYSKLEARPLARRSSSLIPLSVQQETVVANVFPGASPKLIETGDGQLLLWEYQDPLDPVLQSTEISWSFNDGSGWSAPQLVVDDTQVELDPVAAVDGKGVVVATWTRIKDPAFDTPITTTSDLPLFYKELEVVTAIFDPVAQSWTTPIAITDDSAMDTDLHLSSDAAGNVMMTWLKNPDGEFLSTTTSPSQLWFSLWDQDTKTWSPPATVATGLVGVAEHAPALRDNEAFIVLPRDPNLDAPDDGVLDLYTWNGAIWSSASTFAAGGVENRVPSAIYDSGGEGHVVWLRAGNLVWATLSDPSPVTVRAASDSMSFYGAKFFTNTLGDLTLVWQEVVDNGPANIFARILDPASGTWSVDRRLTEEPEVMHRELSGYYGSDGILRAAYLATQISRTTRDVDVGGEVRTLTNIPQEGQTDLRVLSHALVVDLAVTNSDLVLNPPFPKPGEDAVARLQVHNAGDFAVGSFGVELYGGDPAAGGTLLGSSEVAGPFPGGDTAALQFSFTMPPGADEVVAVVDSGNAVSEVSELNNQAAVFSGNEPPVAMVTADVTSGPIPLTVNFSAAGSYDPDDDALTYSWTFGDGTSGLKGSPVSHTFTETGRFPVTLEVIDEHGGRDSVGVLVSTCVGDLYLSNQSVTGTETFDGCNSVTAQSGFTVTSTADVTFRAGNLIILGNGFSVERGASFKAVIDPFVRP